MTGTAVAPPGSAAAERTGVDRALAALRRDDRAWDAFVEASISPSHLQLTGWARVKAATGWRAVRIVADGGTGPVGAQLLVRRIGPGPFSMGYAPRGPVAAGLDPVSLGVFTAELRRVARRERLTHVTIDPGVEADGLADELGSAGWQPADAVQHERTRLIHLTPSEEELWAGLRATTRRYVNRARRDGCRVREGGRDDLASFHAILVETAGRSGFIHRSLDAYRQVFDAFAPAGHARLLFADLPDGTPAATKLLVTAGGRLTQPYSGMTAAGAALRANHLLEWETIRRAREAGERVYDMWGLANEGIAYFKAGFGGREVTYVGTWDLVTLPLLHDALVRARRSYVWLARRRRGLAPASGERGGESASERDGGPASVDA